MFVLGLLFFFFFWFWGVLFVAFFGRGLFFLFFFFFVNKNYIRSSGQDLVVRLYLKTRENILSVVLWERVWSVHIPVVCMVKF